MINILPKLKSRPTQIMKNVMVTKHQVHNLIILDESGSMESIKDSIIKGFNEIVQTVKGIATQFPEQEHLISLVTFNGLGQKVLHFIEPVEKLSQIDATRYKPDASTPLFDAMGFSFAKLRKVLKNVKDYNVLVTVMTDGEENASREYSGFAIKKLIEELQLNRWTFTYIGADHDVEKFATSISITNTMCYGKTAEGCRIVFGREMESRMRYSQKIRNQESTCDGYYEESKPKRISDKWITKLSKNEIFVFGSNLVGAHGGGAAAIAHKKFGAVWGEGVGLHGQTYAIPTMQGGVETIKPYIDEFLSFAKAHPELKFLVTEIGCGIAGFTVKEIAPLFCAAIDENIENVYLPESFYENNE